MQRKSIAAAATTIVRKNPDASDAELYMLICADLGYVLPEAAQNAPKPSTVSRTVYRIKQIYRSPDADEAHRTSANQ